MSIYTILTLLLSIIWLISWMDCLCFYFQAVPNPMKRLFQPLQVHVPSLVPSHAMPPCREPVHTAAKEDARFFILLEADDARFQQQREGSTCVQFTRHVITCARAQRKRFILTNVKTVLDTAFKTFSSDKVTVTSRVCDEFIG